MSADKKSQAPCAVSKCLLGIPCRYDGAVKKVTVPPWGSAEVIAVCPETAAGLSVPRTPCEIVGGDGADVLLGTARVLDINGADKTDDYIRGAEICADMCKVNGVTQAYLKSKSLECGAGRIYDGSHTGKLIQGDGIFAAMLKEMCITVTETEAD